MRYARKKATEGGGERDEKKTKRKLTSRNCAVALAHGTKLRTNKRAWSQLVKNSWFAPSSTKRRVKSLSSSSLPSPSSNTVDIAPHRIPRRPINESYSDINTTDSAMQWYIYTARTGTPTRTGNIGTQSHIMYYVVLLHSQPCAGVLSCTQLQARAIERKRKKEGEPEAWREEGDGEEGKREGEGQSSDVKGRGGEGPVEEEEKRKRERQIDQRETRE